MTRKDGKRQASRTWPRELHEQLMLELADVIETHADEEDAVPDDLPLEVEALLQDAIRERATDVHVDAHSRGVLVRLRIDGRLLDTWQLAEREGQRLINQFRVLARLNTEHSFTPEESRISYMIGGELIDLRLAYAPTINGQKLSIRVLRPMNDTMQMQELGLDRRGLESIQDWVGNLSGMLLVVGPTGSGKTTTLYSLLHRLKTQDRNVVTIEDPVEYQVDGISQMQVDRDHGLDFAQGVKAMLRLDPDYLMLGEIREAGSADAAVTAATSGRALMGTLHSRDAVGVIDTLRSYGLSGEDIAATVAAVISQRLVRKLCSHCKQEVEIDAGDREWIESLGRETPATVWKAEGCDHCRQLGYHGRIGVFEVWRIAPGEYPLLLEEADRHTLLGALRQRGHVFLIDDALHKVAEGVTSMDELRQMAGLGRVPRIDNPQFVVP